MSSAGEPSVAKTANRPVASITAALKPALFTPIFRLPDGLKSDSLIFNPLPVEVPK